MNIQTMNWNGLIFILFALLPTPSVWAGEFDLATASNQVGIDLYRQLTVEAPTTNLAISPYSIECALALAYAGADGETRMEMARVLHFSQDDQSLAVAFASLRESLDRIASKSLLEEQQREKYGEPNDFIEWHAANRLFGQQDYGFRNTFLERLKADYNAPLDPVDFKHHVEEERLKIDAWVEDQTKKRIRDIIPAGGIRQDTRMVLVNAIYLKAPWEKLFEKYATLNRPFYPAGLRTEAVPTMKETTGLGYLKQDGFTAVVIPYQGRDLQMLILLPDDRDGLDQLRAKITPALLRTCANNLDSQLVTLYLPKFRLESSPIALKQNLEALGMKTAFDVPKGSANFDRAAPRRPNEYLSISEIFHKAFIAVDEQGTEAAAATAIVVFSVNNVVQKLPEPIEVRIDHPFFFAVQHRASGVCLFLGSIVDPH